MSVLNLRRLKLLYINTYIFSSYLTENNVFPSERPISEMFFGKNSSLLRESYAAHKHNVTENKQRILT